MQVLRQPIDSDLHSPVAKLSVVGIFLGSAGRDVIGRATIPISTGVSADQPIWPSGLVSFHPYKVMDRGIDTPLIDRTSNFP